MSSFTNTVSSLFWLISLGHIPRSGIAVSKGMACVWHCASHPGTLPAGCAHCTTPQRPVEDDGLFAATSPACWASKLGDRRLNPAACSCGRGSGARAGPEQAAPGFRGACLCVAPEIRAGGYLLFPELMPGLRDFVRLTKVCLTPKLPCRTWQTRSPRSPPPPGRACSPDTRAHRRHLFSILEHSQLSLLSKASVFFQSPSVFPAFCGSFRKSNGSFSFLVILLTLCVYLAPSREALNKSLGPKPEIFRSQRPMVGRPQTLESGY